MAGSSNYRIGVRIDGNASGLSNAAREALRAQRLLAGGSQREYQRMHDARRALGVRAERDIQREIQHTEAAYNRLARSGKLSWQEQRMAAKSMREEVTRLTNEMGRLTTRQKIALGAKGVAAAGAGIGIATAIAAPKVQAALDYDTRLVHLANTAFSDRDVAGRAAGMRDLNKMIVDAVRYGGGTRESAVGTAEQLFGSGIFKPGEVQKILREAMMAGSASNADPQQFAQMAITANQTMGIKPEQMARVFGIGTYAGQMGGFEIKDMARWLPQQMAAAKAVGMYGEAGFAKLAALNQAAVVTAGTRDEAGNNVVNLLAKLGSQDTKKDFQKQGINLPKELAQGRIKGLDAVDVLGDLLQAQLNKDKNYQAVQRQLANSKNDEERRNALEAVGGIAQGTIIGKVFQDRQALMGLYGYMQNRERVASIAAGSMRNTDASQRNFELLASQPGFKVQQAKNEAEIAQQASLDRLTPTIGSLADKTAALVREYPGYTTAVVGATGALVALAGSAAAAAAASWLMTRGRGPVGTGPIVPPAAGGAGAAASGAARAASTAGAATAAGGVGRTLGMLGKAGGYIGLASAMAGLFFTSDEEMEVLRNADRRRQGYRGRGFEDPRLLTRRDGGAQAFTYTARSSPEPLAQTLTASNASQREPLTQTLTAINASKRPDLPAQVQSQADGAAYHRGAGFEDPRLLNRGNAGTQSLADRLAGRTTATAREELRGEIIVRVSAAPGLNVQAETKSSTAGVPLRADVGATMHGTGH